MKKRRGKADHARSNHHHHQSHHQNHQQRVTSCGHLQDEVAGLGSGSPSVVLDLCGQDLDLVLLDKALHVSLITSALPDLTNDGGHDVAAGLHDTDEFTDSLGTNVRLCKSADTCHDIIRVILCGQGPRQIRHVQVAIGTCSAGLVEHARAEVDTVDLLCTQASQEVTDKAGAATSIQDLNIRADGLSS
ncbi:hypothetical protein HG530_002259 [Fusarium avenaceum]|nr:hypothetical protein HG530_002259 [Fusarium avenaceum]